MVRNLTPESELCRHPNDLLWWPTALRCQVLYSTGSNGSNGGGDFNFPHHASDITPQFPFPTPTSYIPPSLHCIWPSLITPSNIPLSPSLLSGSISRKATCHLFAPSLTHVPLFLRRPPHLRQGSGSAQLPIDWPSQRRRSSQRSSFSRLGEPEAHRTVETGQVRLGLRRCRAGKRLQNGTSVAARPELVSRRQGRPSRDSIREATAGSAGLSRRQHRLHVPVQEQLCLVR